MTDLTVKIREMESYVKPMPDSPKSIVEVCQPEGKDIIHLAGYGGYAQWLLYKGANTVRAVDVAEDAIKANKIQKALIQYFSHTRAWHFMVNLEINEKTYPKWLNVLVKRTEIDEEYIKHYFNSVIEWYTDPIHQFHSPTAFLIGECFPYMHTREAFVVIKNAIKEGRWNIVHDEMLNFLENCEESCADVIYGSTMRNWVFYSYLEKHFPPLQEPLISRAHTYYKWEEIIHNNPLALAEFVAEFDTPLAHAAHKCLKKGGKFIDAVPAHARSEFPNYYIPFSTYWKDFEDGTIDSDKFRIAIVRK